MHPRIRERAQEPRYTFPEAQGLVGRPSRTLRRWALGHRRQYQGKPVVDDPLIPVDGAPNDETPLSFLNLLELKFLSSYRKQASLPAIRRALDYAAKELGVERPLLDLDFKISGKELFLRFAESEGDSSFVNASRQGQMAWPKALDGLFESLEYDEKEQAVYRWWPLGLQRPVIVDTGIRAGQPVTAHTGVRTLAIASRARQGWKPQEIAEDVEADSEEIAAALALEGVAA